MVTALAFVSALAIGAVLIAIADPDTRAAASYFFAYPIDTFTAAGRRSASAYLALFQGAIFNPTLAAKGTLTGYLYPISETLVNATPLIVGGLSVGLAFRAGLFNIGGQGQIIIGAIFAGYVGFHWHLPAGIHVIAAILAGMLGGALWGGLAGWLKARTGAHEVITTIMLNYIAFFPGLSPVRQGLPGAAVRPGDLQPRRATTHSCSPCSAARCASTPDCSSPCWRRRLTWWLLKYSRLGFRLRAVGANPFAARTAGMSVERSYTTVMLLAGALSGLAGVSQILGTNTQVTQDIDAGIGFDAITVALLGRANPSASCSPGCCSARCTRAAPRCRADTPIDLVAVIQSLIVLFIAAPALIRAIFRIKTSGEGVGSELAKGWNG